MTDQRLWELDRTRTSLTLSQKALSYTDTVTELLDEIASLKLKLEEKVKLPNDYLDRLQQFENLKKHVARLASCIGYGPPACASCGEGEDNPHRVPEYFSGSVVMMADYDR